MRLYFVIIMKFDSLNTELEYQRPVSNWDEMSNLSF
jgi:hypothetical protein